MAESKTAVTPLSRTNYATWKVQCRMALIKDGLWSIVNGTETAPTEGAGQLAKFTTRRDRVAKIVLSINPNLLYMFGPDPTDPVAVWKMLSDFFQRKTWANKLELKQELFSSKLSEGGSMQEHIKLMTEMCNELCALGETVSEEDRVVYLLASLPESYGVLVTALESGSEISRLEVVNERLLHHEMKMQGSQEEALTSQVKRCYFCKRPGHFKRDCEEFKCQSRKSRGNTRVGAFKVTITSEDEDSTNIEGTGLVVQHALSANGHQHDQWILNSGATCHMCHRKSLFKDLKPLSSPVSITLRDGCQLQAKGCGNVIPKMNVPLEKEETQTLHNVLWVPGLTYHLLSITAASKRGKVTTFSKEGCQTRDSKSKLVASGNREGLYYLNQGGASHQAFFSQDSQRTLWHRRLCHLGKFGIEKLVNQKMVQDLDFDCKQDLEFCEPCVKGKSHHIPFKCKSDRKTSHALELVHSDVCGKIGVKSLSGGEYFVTYVDDYTRHSWIFILKNKSEVFSQFQKWQTEVERSIGKQIQTLRSDNTGEYTSNEPHLTLLSMTEG